MLSFCWIFTKQSLSSLPCWKITSILAITAATWDPILKISDWNQVSGSVLLILSTLLLLGMDVVGWSRSWRTVLMRWGTRRTGMDWSDAGVNSYHHNGCDDRSGRWGVKSSNTIPSRHIKFLTIQTLSTLSSNVIRQLEIKPVENPPMTSSMSRKVS